MSLFKIIMWKCVGAPILCYTDFLERHRLLVTDIMSSHWSDTLLVWLVLLKCLSGLFFVVEDDIREFSQMKVDKRFQRIVTMLRHCKRLQEIRGGGLTRYMLLWMNQRKGLWVSLSVCLHFVDIVTDIVHFYARFLVISYHTSMRLLKTAFFKDCFVNSAYLQVLNERFSILQIHQKFRLYCTLFKTKSGILSFKECQDPLSSKCTQSVWAILEEEDFNSYLQNCSLHRHTLLRCVYIYVWQV